MLDFYALEDLLTPEEKEVQKAARRFLEKEALPHIRDWWEEGVFPTHLIPRFAELGFLGPTLPPEYGGAGVSSAAYGLICYELERVDSGLRSFVSVQSSLVMYPIYAYGSEEQKREFLPKLARGEMVGCFGLTEPDGGSDPYGNMKTRARREGDTWVLNGTKMWITNGNLAHLAVIWAKDEGGWQTALVEFPPARVARDGAARAIEDLPPFDPDDASGSTRKKRKLGPDELLALVRDARDSGENVAAHLVLAAEGFDEYGEMTVHAAGRVALPNEPNGGFNTLLKRARGKTEVYKLGLDPTFVPLGTAFRACERAQRSKYARLKRKAFASLHKHVSGDFEPFVKDDRAQIAPSLLDHIRDLNFLDNRLHRFAARLFDERFEANEEKIRREVIPPKLPK